MSLRDSIRRRRMVRAFAPTPLPAELVTELVELATWAPSAGNSQGSQFLVLSGPCETGAFWRATTDPSTPADRWLTGVSSAPVLVLVLSDPQRYLDRYAEADKGWTDRSLERWPIPYWDTDAAMGAMLLLVGAHEAGLGALFFGVPAPRHTPVRAEFGIPQHVRIVGVVALGHPRPHPRSRSLARGRRSLRERIYFGRYGASSDVVSDPTAKMGRTDPPTAT